MLYDSSFLTPGCKLLEGWSYLIYSHMNYELEGVWLQVTFRQHLRQMSTIRKCSRLRNWKPRHKAMLKADLIWWYRPCFPIVPWPLLLYLHAGGKMWVVAVDLISIRGHNQRKRDVSSCEAFFRPSKNFLRSPQPTRLHFCGPLETNHWQDNWVCHD